MTSEHTHDWEYFAIDKRIQRACNDCRTQEEVDVEGLEQEIARLQQALDAPVEQHLRRFLAALQLIKEATTVLDPYLEIDGARRRELLIGMSRFVRNYEHLWQKKEASDANRE